MANSEHLRILKQGVKIWNEWREKHPEIKPDLSNAILSGQRGQESNGDGISVQIYMYANFRGANLKGADLSFALLRGADFREADLTFTRFDYSLLDRADFTDAKMSHTQFTSNDLREIKGLDTVRHSGPSSISIDALYQSGGKISDMFLQGCGIPDDFITFIPSLFGVQQAIQFYSCFISYSTKDEEFARRLYSRMRDEHLRVWFAPEDIKGGQKIYEQIERAIQMHDRLLLVLSEKSMQSEWVITEIRNARQIEVNEKRRKLFPIRLVDFETIRKWMCFDAEAGKDLAIEVREYFIPDFSNWRNHDAFEDAFGKLLRDLRAEEARESRA